MYVFVLRNNVRKEIFVSLFVNVGYIASHI